MEEYIKKSALVAEIKRRIKERDIQMKQGCWVSSTYMYEDLLDFLDTLEVKDANEALRTEYEKGRADVIEKACEFLKSYRQDTLDGTGYISGIINDETIEEFKKVVGK